MAGVLPSGLPSFTDILTEVDRTNDDMLCYDASAQQLKNFSAGQMIRAVALNTVNINQLSDFPTPVANVITLLASTVYNINAAIDLGANTLLMQSGTAIIGETAQGNTLTSSALITIDTTAGGFVTQIIKGPLRIENTNATGKCINVKSGGFLIYEGALCIASTAATQYGIYCETGVVAVSVKSYTMIGSGTMFYSQGLSSGGTFDGLQSSTLGGDGMIFDGTSGTTVYGDMAFRNCIVGCTGATGRAFYIRGKSAANSAITFGACSFSSANGTAAYFESTAGAGRFLSIQSIGSSFRNTVGGAVQHGVNLTNAYFDVANFIGGSITTKGTGASYCVTGDPAKVTALFAFQNVLFENTVTAANIFLGFDEKSTRVDVINCFNSKDSAVTGNLYVSAGTGTFVTSGVASEIASVTINAVDASANLERCSIVVSDTAYRLKFIGVQSAKKSVSYTISYTQNAAATVTCTFELFGSTLGLINGATTATTLTAVAITATTSITIPATLPPNEELFIKVTAAGGTPTITFRTLTIAVS